jgi:hypothetical protein
MINKQAIFELISETESNDEIRMLVNITDRLWRQDKIQLDEKDWPELSRTVQKAKSKNDERDRMNAP